MSDNFEDTGNGWPVDPVMLFKHDQSVHEQIMNQMAELEIADIERVKEMTLKIVRENCEAIAALPWTKKPETWRDKPSLL
jgi:hypothetical protein